MALPGLGGYGVEAFSTLTKLAPIIDGSQSLRDNKTIPLAGQDVAKKAKTEPFVLFGHSYGGMVAMEACKHLMKDPMFQGCILCSTVASKRSEDLPHSVQARKKFALEYGLEEEFKVSLPYVIHDSIKGQQRDDIQSLRLKNALSAGVDTYAFICDAIDDRPDQHETLKELAFNDVPVFILHGDSDMLIPVSEAMKMYDSLLSVSPTDVSSKPRRSSLTVLDNTGHLPILEKPTESFSAISSWWNSSVLVS